MTCIRACVCLLLGLLGLGALGVARVYTRPVSVLAPVSTTEETVEFGRHVRPILVRHCLACHGFDPSTREADLRLDTFEFATAARSNDRHAAIVPGDPDASLLLHRVTDADPDVRMPPERPALEPEEIETLRAWIAQGASYEPHWSLRPLEPREPPSVAPSGWAAGPIDRFVHVDLAEAGLEPAPLADRRTLLRRLCFDLTGLPPTPAQTQAFLTDSTEDAYARLVEDLLESPHYGERWARHWLDLMRYAETYAHEFDYPIRHAFQYRDYVIRAFNADVPYDQLVTEHIAGDLVTEPRRNPEEFFNESVIGTGFWWLSQGTHSPVDVLQDEAERIDNQIDVLSKAFLATTVSCARCHDHKFDPVLTREYYGLAAFVQSSRRQEAYLDPDGRIGSAVAELETLDSSMREALARPDWPVGETPGALTEVLTAVGQVFFGHPAEGELPPSARAHVLANFDDGTYDGWTVEGDAFTESPTPAGPDALAGEGTAAGAGFANTHRRLEGEGSVEADNRVGFITSAPFPVKHRYLHFLIGGGHHPGKTGLRLRIDGQVVQEATGNNSLRLVPHRFDLTPHQGREATVEIFDQVTGGWGNIRVDELVLSDEASLAKPAARDPRAVAAEWGVDPETLGRWVEAVQSAAAEDLPVVMRDWLRHCEQAGGDPDAQIESPADGGAAEPAVPADATLFDFADADEFGRWFASGWAFGERATRLGEPRAVGSGLRIADADSADSGRLSESLVGTMRSPTFEIARPFLAVRTRGRGTLRVIIDGYTLDEYNALLWNRVKLDPDSSGWQWQVHDLRKWVGHRAHYEIIDDRADGSIEVTRAVWCAEDRAPPVDPHAVATGTGSAIPLRTYTARIATAAATALRGESTDAESCALASWIAGSSLVPSPDADAQARFAAVQREIPAPMRVMAMQDGTGEEGYVYVRGDHRQRGESAPRAFPQALGGASTIDAGPGSGRLALAEALLDPTNPLPARVIVNRVWHHLMGRGIVESTDDFGLLGSAPTNPALLDHLAWRFSHEMGWSIKSLIREIVASRTYRTGSPPLSPEAREADPLNHLWSVREPRRLDGESLRDAILTVSGDLDPQMYGPSVPVHLTPFMTGRGRPGTSGPLDGERRRSIYLEVRRNFLSPMMLAFDSPNPHQTLGKRNESNVPAQSLILLNDPFVVEQAGRMASRLIEDAPEVEARIAALYLRALARAPSETETRYALAFLQQQAAEIGVAEWRDNSAVWADLCHAVFNLKEFMFIE